MSSYFFNFLRGYVPTGRLDQVMELVSGTTTSLTFPPASGPG